MESCGSLNSLEVTVVSVILIILLLVARIPIYIAPPVVPIIAVVPYGGLPELFDVFRSTLVSTATWSLVFSVIAIGWLVSLYEMTGSGKRLSMELPKVFRSSTLALTLIPGIIGVFPVPGGALMSALIVDHLGSQVNMSAVRKLFINVWYRHVLIYVYPLSPVIILASAVTGLNLWDILLRQLPVAIAMFITGLPLVGFKEIGSIGNDGDSIRFKVLLKDFTPIVAALVLAPLLSPLDDLLGVERISLIFAVLAAVLIFTLLQGIDSVTLIKSLGDRKVWEMAVLSFRVMMFRELFISMDEKPIVELLLDSGINGTILAVLLPIFFSLISGQPTGGIAIAVPVLTSITEINLSIASLICASAFMGYIISPLHLCYVYTAQYYKASIVEGYKYMIPAFIASLAVAILLFIAW